MGDRSHIFYQADVQSCQLERPQGRVSSGSRSPNKDLYRMHAMIHSFFCGTIGGLLCCKRGPLSGSPESHATRTRPGDDISLGVRNRDNGVVKGRVDVGNTF